MRRLLGFVKRPLGIALLASAAAAAITVFTAFFVVPPSVQVFLAGMAGCDVPDDLVAVRGPEFRRFFLTIRPVAALYRLKEAHSDGPYILNDEFADDLSVYHALVTAAEATGGRCNAEVTQLAERYIELGAPMDHYNRRGLTALHEAVMFGQVDLVRVLVLNGADGQLRVRATDTPLYGMTSVEIAEYMTARTRNASRDAIVALLRASARRR